MAHDVFISYSTKDKPAADTVCARLEMHGIRCWIAPRDVLPGHVWGESIVNAIRGSRAMVLVLSENANNSDNIPKEVELACAKGVIVIPFRIEDVVPAKSLDYFLSNVHWLDALTTPLDQHVEQLANVIKKILGEPQTVRPVPPPVPSPIPPPATIPAKQPMSLGKVVAIAGASVAIVAIIVIGVLFASRKDNPNPVVYHDVVQTPGSNPAEPPPTASRQDAIIGCWQWTLPVQGPVVIRRDGTMTGSGVANGRWSNIDPRTRKYRFNWQDPVVDDIFITPDGQHMSGKNQFGFPTSATRLTNADTLAGNWRWYNNVVVAIHPDGTLTVGTINAHWRVKNISANEFTITWPNAVDTITLSGNGTSLSGSNQFGVPIAAAKGSGCGNQYP